MNEKHWMVIAAALGALALQLHGLKDWHAMTPEFVSGLILLALNNVGALFVEPPGAKPDTVPVPRP